MKNERNGMKNVGRINREPCSQFPCDYFLDNMAPCMSEIALKVAAKIASFRFTEQKGLWGGEGGGSFLNRADSTSKLRTDST
jgi:hypothetical protein